MGFTEIKTQEEFDAAIKERLDRERKTLSEKFSDYDELKKKNADYEAQVSKLSEANKTLEEEKSKFDSTVAELNSKIKSYETDSAKTRIALETGLPYEFAKRLNGTTEEEIKKDAESLAKFVSKKDTAPIASAEPTKYSDSKNEGIKKLVQSMSNN